VAAAPVAPAATVARYTFTGVKWDTGAKELTAQQLHQHLQNSGNMALQELSRLLLAQIPPPA
jgi:hypothetical protein